MILIDILAQMKKKIVIFLGERITFNT